MKYFKYYRLTTLMNLNRKGLGFSAIFVVVYIFLTSAFLSENGSWTMGPSTFFIFSLFTMSFYAHQMRFESTNPMYQFPLTSREKTKYDYISVFVVFIGLSIALVLLGLVFLGIFELLGDVSITDGEEVTTNFWTDSYNIAHHLFIVALMMPLSYLESNKKKYILGFVFALMISLIHYVIYFAATGSLSILNPVTAELINLPNYQFIVIGILIISIVSTVFSYKKSVLMNSYK